MTSLVELDHRKRADKSNFRKLEDILGLLMLIGMTVLVSLRTTGVPGVGLIVLSMVFNQVGLPIEGIALIMGVDRLLDMMRTGGGECDE